MPQGRVPDRRKSVVCSLLRVLQRHSKIFHSVLHAKGRRPCRKARKPHLTHCRSIYYICIYQIFSLLLRHEKGLQHGIEKGHRGGPGETHPKTQAAPSGNGGVSHTLWPSSITGAILACLWFAQGLHSREITEACSFHLCYYQLEPAGSITSRQAYGAGMPAILIICRW